jgi:hypothetical protein
MLTPRGILDRRGGLDLDGGMKEEPTAGKRGGTMVRLAMAVFVGLVLWSVVSETLVPLYRAGKTTELVLNLAGIPVALLGTAVFAYGGYVFVRDTFGVWGSPEMVENTKLLKSDPRRKSEAARRNRGILFRAWKPGLIRMGTGFLLIAIASVIINWLKITGRGQMM